MDCVRALFGILGSPTAHPTPARVRDERVLLRLRVEPSRNRPVKKASKLLTFSTSRRNGTSPLVTEKERAGSRFEGENGAGTDESVRCSAEVLNRQETPTDARRSAEAPSAESASKHRETVPPDEGGGGGGNRTHVRWTVLARPYERSLRFIFARRKPAGGSLAKRSGSPSRPFAPTMSTPVAASQKRSTPDTHRREPSPEMTVLPQSWQRRALPGCRDSRSRRVSGGVGAVPNRGG